MTTDGLLLKAVFANPDDDLPRLVYADWLDENGQGERAEFVRVQCELAKIPVKTLGPADGNEELSLHRLRRRESNLLGFGPGGHRRYEESNWFKWAGPAAGIVPRRDVQGFVTSMFRRGFVAEVRCTLADWCGGECVGCEGRGHLRIVVGGRQHDACNGTGRTPGIGPQVVARHPVERVVLTDREPFEGEAEGKTAWGWCEDRGAYPAECRIGEVLNYLPSEGRAKTSSVWFRFYHTRKLAMSALSAALIVWARSQIS
jgi:uncharacterized protein (TIGR02996 family)